jgi:hypothetical protein
MDKGQIVFVPETHDSKKIEDLKWRIIVTDQSIMDVALTARLSGLNEGIKYKVSVTFLRCFKVLV